MPIECRSWNFQASVGAMMSWERSTPRLPVPQSRLYGPGAGLNPVPGPVAGPQPPGEGSWPPG